MKLGQQVMLVSLLMLGIPWGAVQYLQELESALRQGQEQALQASTRAIAASLTQQSLLPGGLSADPDSLTAWHDQSRRPHDAEPGLGSPVYAEPVGWPFVIDGYDHEWQGVGEHRFNDAAAYPLKAQLRAAIQGQYLLFYLRVHDNAVQYHNRALPAFENGDRLELYLGDGQRYVLLSGAPGELTAYRPRRGRYVLEQAIEAQWQDQSQGYSIELKLPLRLLQDRHGNSRLGFNLVDVNSDRQERAQLGNYRPHPGDPELPLLLFRNPALQRQLALFEQPGLRLRLIDAQSWLIASNGSLDDSSSPGTSSHWFSRWLYRSLVAEERPNYPPNTADQPGLIRRLDVQQALSGQLGTHWYQDPEHEQGSVLSVALPLQSSQYAASGELRAVLLAEETNERLLSLTDRPFQQLLLSGLVTFLLTGVGLVAYAAWLSFRIRRLSQATSAMMAAPELRLEAFPHSMASDEIGTLTRSFRLLFKRIQHYTEYLQSLSRKLTHELRTPLAIVRTSLDNLDDHAVRADAQVYVQRARDGAARLSQLLTALGEATRMEEAIQQADTEPLNLAAFLDELVSVYRQLHPRKRIELEGVLPMHLLPTRTTLDAAPELLAQLFDKLIANAVDFTADGKEIRFRYQEHSRHVIVELSNEGPLLPAQLRHQIFDQLVSARPGGQEKEGDRPVHLGLGLYIARLVVEFHQGHIRADNLEDKHGVVFSVCLPLRQGE